MARTVYLHLGPAKTGTSAVQYILSRHDGSIALYPRTGLWPDGSHHNLVLNFFGDYQRPEMVRVDPDQLLAQIGLEARASDQAVVLSSEILAGRRTLNEFATAVQAAIGEECRVVLVVVAREHRERAASLYNQRVKDAVHGEIRDPDAFLTDHPDRFCYSHLLRRLRKTGFELVVLNYHPAEDFAVRCLGLFGFAPEQIPPVPRRNVSLGRVALIATLAANRAAESQDQRARFDAVSNRITDHYAKAHALFTRRAVGEVQDIITADRRFLRQQFELKLPRPEKPPRTSPFVISEEEFAGLALVTQELGAYGARIQDQLRSFVEGPPGAMEAGG